MDSLISCIVVFVATLIHFSQLVNTEDTRTDDPSTWPGHMEPLGSRNIKHAVQTVDEFPKPEDFFRNFVHPGKPLLIKNGAKISPAFKLWTDDYFLSLDGAETTTVFVEQGKKENRTFPGVDTNFKEFVLKYNDSDVYMVNGVPRILQKDVLLPPSLLCEDLKPYLVDTVMWFSSGGTKSVFHHDDVDNINCLYSGTKNLLFVEYLKYRSKLRLDHAWGGFSGVDIDQYHQVTSTGRNIAVNIWFSHLRSYTPKNCDKMEKGATLDKFQFTSLQNETEGNDDSEENQQELGGLLELLAQKLKVVKEMSYDQFVTFLRESVPTAVKPEFDADVLEILSHVFQSADVNKDGVVGIKDIAELDDKAFGSLENNLAELEGILGEYHDPMYHDDDVNPRDEL